MILDVAAPSTFIDWINSGGIIGLLAFALIANWKGWWVSGSYHKEAIRQVELRNEELQTRCTHTEEQNVRWMELAFKATSVSEQVSEIVRKTK